MRSFPQNPRHDPIEKNLIAEQPARLILFGGVILALILGLSVRGITSPAKVQAMVAMAAGRIHKDVTVTFDGASLSLARGLLPRLAVVIKNVRMESPNACWMSPQLSADEIRLPLSIWSLLQGQNPITQVEAGFVQVILRTDYKNCEQVAPAPEPFAARSHQFVTIKSFANDAVTKPEPPPQVEAVLIDRLRIVTEEMKDPLELSSFAIRLKSNSPRVVEMTARTRLMKDAHLIGDYWSHASVWGEYTEFPKKTLRARVSGNWREGSFNLGADYAFKEEELRSQLDLKHIPMSQLLEVFRKMSWTNEDLNPRQVWVSLNADLKASGPGLKTAALLLKGLQLEGDLGDVRASEIRVKSLNPLRTEPFSLDLENVSVGKVLAITNHPQTWSTLGHLGKFTGEVNVKDFEHIQIEGDHRGFEFIFANRGQREVQTLTEFHGAATLENNKWQMKLNDIQPEDGAFEGSLEATADRALKDVQISGSARKISFAPKVVRLMTSGGVLSPFAGDFRLKLSEGRIQSLGGALSSDLLNIDGVALEKARIQLSSVSDEIVAQAQAQRANIQLASSAYRTLATIVDAAWLADGAWRLRNLATQLRFGSAHEFSWKNLIAQNEKGGRFTSEGGWNSAGTLQGTISTPSEQWIVSGKRDQPLFQIQPTKKKNKL